MSEQFVAPQFRVPPVANKYASADNEVLKALATEQIMDAGQASHALRALARAVLELRQQLASL